jgi:uncharacterized protein YkwD
MLVGLIIVAAAIAHRRESASSGSSVTLTPTLLGIRLDGSESRYARDDPWQSYLAPESACPHGEDRSAPAQTQEQTMVCLLNWARARRGLPGLPLHRLLSRSARLKALDIDECGEFAHEACGKEADAVAQAVGYRRAGWGENLYAGSGILGSPRVAVDRWLNSAGHRRNLFRPEWSEQGVALRMARSFDGATDVAIWVSHFGRQ